MSNKNIIIFFILTVILVGCAGSAQHKVISAYSAGDENLSCQDIQGEIIRAQVIIDEVNSDKSGISGADVIVLDIVKTSSLGSFFGFSSSPPSWLICHMFLSSE